MPDDGHDGETIPALSGARRCVAKIRNGAKKGQRCGKPALSGATCCDVHLRGKKPRAHAAIRAEVSQWVMDDSVDDPGETLLRLLTQSRRRADRYATLIGQAYDAAEKLRESYKARDMMAELEPAAEETLTLGEDTEDERTIRYTPPDAQVALDQLDRIFTTGGVAALIGHKYAATQTGHVYAVGEAIRGLVELEAAERDRCANFAKLALAAGLAERATAAAERQGAVLTELLAGVLESLEVPADIVARVPDEVERHLALASVG